jgi:hypothetical protein
LSQISKFDQFNFYSGSTTKENEQDVLTYSNISKEKALIVGGESFKSLIGNLFGEMVIFLTSFDTRYNKTPNICRDIQFRCC